MSIYTLACPNDECPGLIVVDDDDEGRLIERHTWQSSGRNDHGYIVYRRPACQYCAHEGRERETQDSIDRDAGVKSLLL